MDGWMDGWGCTGFKGRQRQRQREDERVHGRRDGPWRNGGTAERAPGHRSIRAFRANSSMFAPASSNRQRSDPRVLFEFTLSPHLR